MDYFYDGQIRRYLLQFMRIFSVIRIRNGPDANGLFTIQRVPILYGDSSTMVSQLIKGASENTLLPSPLFSAYIDSIKPAPKRRMATQYVGKVSTIEREFTGGAYTDQPGVRQDVERYMPVPYDITFKLDCWTTNTTTKLQIFEQIATIFNPMIQLQQDSNLLDWTSIFECNLDDTTWTNRSIGTLTGDERDVMSFKFTVGAWINPPAKIKRSGLIAEIVTNIYNVADVDDLKKSIASGEEYDPFSCLGQIPIQIITTEGNYRISVAAGTTADTITLLNQYGQVDPALSWFDLIQKYGQITPNITNIRLKLDPNIEVDSSDIIGTIAIDPANQNVLFFTPDIDTYPANTIPQILEIIDPIEVTPGNGLPTAVAGQRYLLTSHDSAGEEPAIPPNVATSPWGQTLIAYPNDVIEFDGIKWVVIFDSRNATGKNYLVNSSNNSQYMFDGKDWSYTYFGQYAPGYWRIDNIIQAPNGTTINNYE